MRTIGIALSSARRLLHTVAGVLSMCAGVSAARRDAPELVRLQAVVGAETSKCNDLLFSPPLERAQRPHHVIYFPGDVQNYRDVMSAHPENYRWKQWSFEDIASILSRRFPASYIWIVKPSRMHLHKFSCYDNFVESNMFGAPKHSTDLRAIRQLHSLLVNAFPAAQNLLLSQSNKYEHRNYDVSETQTDSAYSTNGCHSEGDCVNHCSKDSSLYLGSPSVKDSLSFTVIGFSKGCVVLNQFLHELQEAKKEKDLSVFVGNIESMYWLDGGHSGGSNTWITCPDILKVFAQTQIAVHAHVTPYQVSDSMRSWIGEEHRKFVELLKGYHVMVNNHLHFGYEVPSLDNHFRVHEFF
ncbi:mitochondrial protein C2orf69 homolog [Hyperolius riggenbachi]|uniref:mitochondrial protein C2orf69 homolog n=1 Tax=Hyperolius riggenbachi TaxID=752182 RepID=UPI0035A369F9